jgi:hypothetical protein
MKAAGHPKFHETWEEVQKASERVLSLCHTEPTHPGLSLALPPGWTRKLDGTAYKHLVHEAFERLHRAQRKLEAIMIHAK